MFRSVLVPLDGSPLSHQAIVPAGDIARRLGASLAVAVAHPWGSPEDAPFAGTDADREMRTNEEQYLAAVRERLDSTFGVPVEAALLEGDAAAALAAFARDRRVDLVVSSTHGRGAVGRVLRGGVSLRLAHAVQCPVLLLKPGRDTPGTTDSDGFDRIMIPLDGTAAAEAATEPALALAAPRGVLVFLVRVIPPIEVGGPRLAERRLAATQYLNQVATRLDARGLRVDCRVVTRANPGSALVALAQRWEVDLLALTTRERGEGERLLLGSVADSVVHAAPLPVLVCHAAVRQASTEAIGGAAPWRFAPRPPVPVPG